jgi:uncharacterized metal-binding protein
VANGRVHSTVSIITGLAGAGYAYAVLHQPIDSCGMFVVGGLAAVILSPDLDHPAGYAGLSYARRVPVFGGCISRLWELYWMPYRWLVGLFTKRTAGAGDSHRSWLSHLPVVGTFLRLAWLLWPLWVFYGWFLPPYPVIAALVVCDVLHSVFDSVMW